jgi:hypothetical protein
MLSCLRSIKPALAAFMVVFGCGILLGLCYPFIMTVMALPLPFGLVFALVAYIICDRTKSFFRKHISYKWVVAFFLLTVGLAVRPFFELDEYSRESYVGIMGAVYLPALFIVSSILIFILTILYDSKKQSPYYFPAGFSGSVLGYVCYLIGFLLVIYYRVNSDAGSIH